ncbi:amidohydrolase family protein [Robertkochia solimangrovi]|uniref:amidohydrolase family protein n=1 Tax=Robertkochia solimangrovi TaxID=2213046 RepID=UPI00117ED508|nr:amidohydrolase family protein [Robertkochia solimangrovi]TRZ43603.1 amidohydrolase [Robertkochia solimangrovi]
MKFKRYLLALLCCGFIGYSQEYIPKNDGVSNSDHSYKAFTNARIIVSPGKIIEKGTLLIKDGVIIDAGTTVSIPENTLVTDLNGKSIYPSFIDLYTSFGMEEVKPVQGGGRSGTPQYDASREGYYWNDHILSDQKAIEHYSYDKGQAKQLVNAGFGIVNTHMNDGIMRGTSMLVALNSDGTDNERIISKSAAEHLSFSRSRTTRQSYPGSLMGAMALIRQVYFDAQWYADGGSKDKDLALEAVIANKSLPKIFEAGGKLNDLRADKIGDEFKLNYILKGGGDEFERIDEIVASNASYIIPVNFPDAYEVTDPYMAQLVSLEDMRMWNQAPENPAVLASHGVPFTLTTADLKKIADFKSNVQKAISYGLDEQKALEALTTTPAQLLGIADMAGSLKKGAWANFLITSGDIFDNSTTLFENWVQGKKYMISDMNAVDIRGTYDLKVGGTTYTLSITGEPGKPKSEIKQNDNKIASKLDYDGGWVNLFYTPESKGDTEFVRLTAPVTDASAFSGQGTLTDGATVNWSASQTAGPEEKSKKDSNTKPEVLPVTYPNKAFGVSNLPESQDVLFKNATVWTSEEDGILEGTDVLVKNGKIAAIGKNLSAGGAVIIDATGKHLTPGIIDEHSHIATAAVNEGGHNSSAEVTIEDVVDSEDSNIYRNLSGGVTTIQILHGSANPIGGRSALIKLKWGEDPEDLLVKDRPKFIKFALGENVKQSNWGAAETIRFPQTRMGVEQLFIDYFQRAKEYDAEWKAYNGLSKRQKEKATKPRVDIELQTLAEILNKERFISCHSYVQSEINMLMKVADQFNFNINTFTHILEGYKVADKMKEHGVGGSTFSDWWAYKYEVNDAIPYNAAIMHNAGITVAINSDDAEMSRRLNQEAGKTVKYGGVSEVEAMKMVTINPAKLLHIDDRTGSIKVGKDADLVLWSDNPLSIYAIADKTMIEGKVYYDYEQMQAMTKSISEERNKLINMMISAKNKGMKTQAPKGNEEPEFHCDTEIYQK